MTGYLTRAVSPAAAVITGHLWLAVAAAAVPCALVCITAIVLVLSVDRGNRVEAIKALPSLITAISKTALPALIARRPGNPRSVTTVADTGKDERDSSARKTIRSRRRA